MISRFSRQIVFIAISFIAACGVAWLVLAPGAGSLARTACAEDIFMPGVMTRRPVAPEFPRGFTWWNTDRPLTFSGDLKGRVVVLDFWTYCCINCVHNLANLEQVEEHFRGKPVVVVGVHSNKFTNEAEAANIRTAMLRYHIKHPVIVDKEHRIWTAYGVSAWPTLVFVDSEGRVAGAVSGEVQPEEIEKAVQTLLDEGCQHGTLADSAPMLRPEAMVLSASGLAFPGKITADPAGERLFIADSGHNQIVVTDRAGRLLQLIGAAVAGNADGAAEEAMFNDPQGMAYDPGHNTLYVADHGNHLIRRVDLKAGRVETILGTGRQDYDRVGGGRGIEQGLNSPWDVVLAGGSLYIAMAGTHQIWRMDLATGQAEAWAGSGRENIKDGPGPNAALAQPSGLAVLGEWLYFADSEVSALRRARLRDADVETLVGHGLFDFGDADGAFGRRGCNIRWAWPLTATISSSPTPTTTRSSG
jgi:thiol-disulfide isomerase/thioredoxin